MKKKTLLLIIMCISIIFNNYGFSAKINNEIETTKIRIPKNSLTNELSFSGSLLGVTKDAVYFENEKKIVEYDLETKKATEIYQIEDEVIYKTFSTEKFFVIASLNTSNGSLDILSYNQTNKVELIKLENVVRIPSCYISSNNKFVYCVEYIAGKMNRFELIEEELAMIDLESKEWRLIKRLRHAVEDDKILGRSIKFSGGNQEYVFFQVIKAENGSFENASIGAVYKYQLDTSENKIIEIEKYDIPFITIFVTGSSKLLLLNQYSSLRPLNGVGKLYQINNSGIELLHTFSEISSGTDILNAIEIEGKLFFNNLNKLFIVWFEDNKIIINEKRIESDIILTPSGVYFIDIEDDFIILNQLQGGLK